MRNAVANGDTSRVVAFYRGFLAESGHHAPSGQQRAYQSRQPATGAKPIYSREQIADYYKARRAGAIPDSKWAAIENDILKAGAEGRVAGALNLRDGTKLTELR
jgi:hypothetical protein